MLFPKITLFAILFLSALSVALPSPYLKTLKLRDIPSPPPNPRCKVCHKCTFDEADPSTVKLAKAGGGFDGEIAYGSEDNIWVDFNHGETREDPRSPYLNLYSGQNMTAHVQIEYLRDVYDESYTKVVSQERQKLIYIAVGMAQCDRAIPESFYIDQVVSIKTQPRTAMKHKIQ